MISSEKFKGRFRIRPKIIVVLGPTASGKSELAAALAQKFNGEIISADSRQVYRGMDIGTGKVPRDPNVINGIECRKSGNYIYKGVIHHLIDVASPKRTFTVAQYQKLGRKALRGIRRRGKLPIVCGGTGFYIDALLYHYPLPNVAPQKGLRKKLEREKTDDLYRKLERFDPRRAKAIDPKNKRRLVRALEIVLTTGKPVPAPLPKLTTLNVLKIGLCPPWEKLKEKIRRRLIKRLREGMVDEVKNLRASGLSWERLDGFGLEYRFISRYLRGVLEYSEMTERLNREIAKYAKRQMTWFKRDKEIKWVTGRTSALRFAKKFLENPAAGN